MLNTNDAALPVATLNSAPELKPRTKRHWVYTLNICDNKYASPKEAAYLKSSFTVFLGQGGHFDYWGDPRTGWVISVGLPEIGCRSSRYGNARAWTNRQTSPWGANDKLTEAGKNWATLQNKLPQSRLQTPTGSNNKRK